MFNLSWAPPPLSDRQIKHPEKVEGLRDPLTPRKGGDRNAILLCFPDRLWGCYEEESRYHPYLSHVSLGRGESVQQAGDVNSLIVSLTGMGKVYLLLRYSEYQKLPPNTLLPDLDS